MKHINDRIEEEFLEANPYAALSDEAALASRSAIYEALKRQKRRGMAADGRSVTLTEKPQQSVIARK